MNKITKIRIPKGKYCGRCKFLFRQRDGRGWSCSLFIYWLDFLIPRRYVDKAVPCLKMFPNGAVFELKVKK